MRSGLGEREAARVSGIMVSAGAFSAKVVTKEESPSGLRRFRAAVIHSTG